MDGHQQRAARTVIVMHDRAPVQPAGHAGRSAQIIQICAPWSATPGSKDLRQNGGSRVTAVDQPQSLSVIGTLADLVPDCRLGAVGRAVPGLHPHADPLALRRSGKACRPSVRVSCSLSSLPGCGRCRSGASSPGAARAGAGVPDSDVAVGVDRGRIVYPYFNAPPEAPATRGFAGILHAGLSSLHSGEVLTTPEGFSASSACTSWSVRLRLRRMAAMLARIKRQVRERAAWPHLPGWLSVAPRAGPARIVRPRSRTDLRAGSAWCRCRSRSRSGSELRPR